ncbi:MAG: ABC transporter ATP-binding protein [Rickettsiales bacterium]|nr:ABC transporter ATP-binding protein [Rickettsiales bacterium]
MNYSDYKILISRIIKEIIWPEKVKIIISIILMILVAGTNSMQALLIQPAVDETLFSKNSANAALYQIPILILVVTIAKAIFTYYQVVLSSLINNILINGMRLRLFRKFITSDMEYFNNYSSAKMLSNILNDINGMMGAINLILSGVFKNALSVIFLFAVMIYMNPTLTLISLIGVPLAIYPIILVYKKINKHMVNNQQQLELFTVVMDDSLRGAKVVKAYNAEDYETEKVNKSLLQLQKLAWKIARISNIPSQLNEALIGVGTAAVLLYGGSLVVNGTSTPGSFFSFFAALMMAYKPMKAVSGMNVQLHLCLICAKRVFNLIDYKNKIIDKIDAKTLSNVKGNINFEDVSFQYSDGKKVLENLSFKLESGKKYALVGHSGGGKSTILNLILRFYDVSSGKILIDENDVRDVTQKSLRDAIAYVGQEVQLFDDTIFENIRYTKKDATIDDVINAAKIAEAHEFISQFENGYYSQVGQNGAKLSGGQRQRIAIARAVISGSPILLLDEATSALDTNSENEIKIALQKLMQGKTTIAIAHRLTTVINSDEILVISKGKIIERGSHKALLELNGEYANLYFKQFVEE